MGRFGGKHRTYKMANSPATTRYKYKVTEIQSDQGNKFRISETSSEEIAINGLVARVHMKNMDADGSPARKLKQLKANKIRMRMAKRKFQEVSPQQFRKRVPKKMKIEMVKTKKLVKTPIKISPKKDVFNGKQAIMKRVIKPNRRLNDFVISSSVRYYAPQSSSREESVSVPTIKEAVPKKVVKSVTPPEIASPTISDKAEVADDDVVRSFLPVFDSSNSDDEQDLKENEISNVEPKLDPPKRRVRLPKRRITNSIKRVISTSKLKHNIKYRWELLEKNLKAAEDTAVRSEPPKKQTKMNGSNNPLTKSSPVTLKDPNVSYILVDSCEPKVNSPKPTDVDFNKLVRCLKLVKLPASNWKIRIVVSKQQTITEVTFTDKQMLNERCIKFSRTFSGYVITFGTAAIKLIGAPAKITSFNDVSILLDIVHNISPNDPVLEYNTSTNNK